MTNYELTIKNVNKSNSKFEIRNLKFVIIFIFLITLVGVGLFGWAGKVNASTANPTETCQDDASNKPCTPTATTLGTCRLVITTGTNIELIRNTNSDCRTKSNYQSWLPSTRQEYDAAAAANTTAGTDKDPKGTCLSVTGEIIGKTGEMTEKKCLTENTGAHWTTNKPSFGPGSGTKTPLEKALKSCDGIDDWSFDGCMQKIFYTIFYVLPAFLLGVTANFFNIILGLTLKGRLLESDFVSSAWGIVRDLSNLFFILILLYVSIKIILDLGSHEAKQTIVNIIIIALLINFSMFFTKVVIDTSNVLALVFYNKLQVTTVVNGTEESYIPATKENEKNVSGSMVGAFDVTKFISEDFFDTLKEKTVVVPSKTQISGALAFPVYGGYLAFSTIKNYYVPQEEVPMGIIISIILIAGSVMIFATYAFLVAGLSFLARIIELWVLIIFSPFAFMSFTIPELKKINYIGWDAWISRLLTTSFMAPIFMFFMYFIFLLINSNIFKDMIVPDKNRTVWASILLLVLPALFILVLLLQATKFAKKGAGTIGEMVMTGAKIVGGLALGAATGGAALVATSTIGAKAQSIANDDKLRARAASGDKGAQRKLALANSVAKSSFDFRQTGVGKFTSKRTGMDFSKGLGIAATSTEKLKGGAKASFDRKVEKEEEKAKSYEMTPSAEAEQNKRVEQYEKDKKQTKIDAENSGQKFNEDIFKEKYEQGKLVGYGRDDRKVEVGSVDPASQINKQRKEAYAWSLENPTMKNATDKKDIKDFLMEMKRGMTGMFQTKGGLGTVAVATALGGPIGAAVAVSLGGLVQAIKATIPANKDLVAKIAKGKSGDQKLLELLKKSAAGDKKAGEEIVKEVKKSNEEKSKPEHEPSHTEKH